MLINVMGQPGQEEGLGEDGRLYMSGWVPSLFTRNHHSIVNQLYPTQNKKFKVEKQTTKKKTYTGCPKW